MMVPKTYKHNKFNKLYGVCIMNSKIKYFSIFLLLCVVFSVSFVSSFTPWNIITSSSGGYCHMSFDYVPEGGDLYVCESLNTCVDNVCPVVDEGGIFSDCVPLIDPCREGFTCKRSVDWDGSFIKYTCFPECVGSSCEGYIDLPDEDTDTVINQREGEYCNWYDTHCEFGLKCKNNICVYDTQIDLTCSQQGGYLCDSREGEICVSSLIVSSDTDFGLFNRAICCSDFCGSEDERDCVSDYDCRGILKNYKCIDGKCVKKDFCEMDSHCEDDEKCGDGNCVDLGVCDSKIGINKVFCKVGLFFRNAFNNLFVGFQGKGLFAQAKTIGIVMIVLFLLIVLFKFVKIFK